VSDCELLELLDTWSTDFDDLRVFSLAMQNKLELSVCLSMLVANVWNQLMQIIVYLPSSSWLQLVVLVRVTCNNAFQCA